MKVRRKGIKCLEEHPEPYVTVKELADYWSVGTKQIYKQLDAGMLAGIRIGPRLLRIHKADAMAFERRAKMRPETATSQPTVAPQPAKLRRGSATHRIPRARRR